MWNFLTISVLCGVCLSFKNFQLKVVGALAHCPPPLGSTTGKEVFCKVGSLVSSGVVVEIAVAMAYFGLL